MGVVCDINTGIPVFQYVSALLPISGWLDVLRCARGFHFSSVSYSIRFECDEDDRPPILENLFGFVIQRTAIAQTRLPD